MVDLETSRNLLHVERKVILIIHKSIVMKNHCEKAFHVVLFFRLNGVILKMLNWLMMAQDWVLEL